MKLIFHALALLLCALSLAGNSERAAFAAEAFVPGTGVFLENICDNFEEPSWNYRYNHPKSSHEQDEKQRGPGGRSSNGLWHEGGKRGTPDLVKRVETPSGGIAGSTGSLLFATRNSGIPGRVANSQQQDDLLMLFDRRLGRSIPIAWQPSATVRVYLPSFDTWENRTGPQFGVRCDCTGRNPDGSVETYWPGMFLLFQSETNRNVEQDFAKISVRGDRRGQDIRKVNIAEPGCGRTWSTKWVIDDPKIYVQPPAGQNVTNLYRVKKRPSTASRQPQMKRSARSSSQGKRSASTQQSNSRR
jgi:hypothetical protein